MARNDKRVSFFDRLMNFADRFFEGLRKLKEMSAQAEKENVEFLDEKIPGYKKSHEEAMASAAKLGSKLESKAEKLLFGKDLYLGAGGEARKEADMVKKKPSLDKQIQSASMQADKQDSQGHVSPQKSEQEHMPGR